MKVALIALALAAGLSSAQVLAQAPVSCADCVKATACSDRRDACIAECRARLFSIDPRRASCVGDCSSKATQCAQAAAVACREKAQCR